MERHQQAVASRGEPDQGEADQRRPGQVEARPAVPLGDPLRRGLALLLGHGRQVLSRPRQVGPAGDELHRALEALVPERGTQVGVPLQQRLPGRRSRSGSVFPSSSMKTWTL